MGDSSFPANHPHLDAELYAVLRYGYDSLPNSEVKRCFFYCAMYKDDDEINKLHLLHMWIGKSLVKSKQGSYLMGMVVGRKYLKLMIDHCLFHRVREHADVFLRSAIGVDKCIHDMAVYIGQKEENCFFMANQDQRILPEVQDENCCRILLANNLLEGLPTQLRCPKLASLTLKGNRDLKELPSEFLLSVTSLRVLNLSGCTKITSIPTAIGQLRILDFLSFRKLPIKDLPEEIGHLLRLQFFHLSITSLASLPSKIGELRSLRCLNLRNCESLRMIPGEISELISLSRLLLGTSLSVEMEANGSIWCLKGLKNLTELELGVGIKVSQDGTKSAIKDGIMGTWSDMRHLSLAYPFGSSDEIMENLPQDMQNMTKLQSFRLYSYKGVSLPNCKFEHLELVQLFNCNNIT